MINERNKLTSRILIIGMAIVLMAAVVFLVGTSVQEIRRPASVDVAADSGAPSQPVNINEPFLANSELTGNGRDLATYYSLRAYHGAPPIVPHAVDDASFGGNDCLQCHENGDYVPPLEAFAPVVPHPELSSCNQCHVTAKTDSLFVESDWQTVPPPTLGHSALPGSPPPIPHGLQLRDNCVSCHAGQAAPVEIQVLHPERESCEQCHVFSNVNEEWER